MYNLIQRASFVASRGFVGWVLAVSALCLWKPNLLLWVLPQIKWWLGVIMFGMGMTLTPDDFKRVFQQPYQIGAGALAQFLIMPFVAYALAHLFRLSPEAAVGLILLGSCPGGTASNVICYLAKGDVALSVSMTGASTVLAPVLTPLLTWILAGHWMKIDAAGMFMSILQIVCIPILLGLAANRVLGREASKAASVMPLISVTAILLIIGAVVGKSSESLLRIGPVLLFAVIMHNGLGLYLGWTAGGLFRMGVPQRRALAIEVGMQNSGLATALAVAHFSPAAALPAVFFSIWHNVTGPFLASVWSHSKEERPADHLPGIK